MPQKGKSQRNLNKKNKSKRNLKKVSARNLVKKDSKVEKPTPEPKVEDKPEPEVVDDIDEIKVNVSTPLPEVIVPGFENKSTPKTEDPTLVATRTLLDRVNLVDGVRFY